ncbi:MAG: TlpA disulfide reductase family protein [Planctomycetota bacterium]
MPRTVLAPWLALVLTLAPTPLAAQRKSPILGKPLPELALSHSLQGEAWSAEGLRGKIVVLDVFQVGCPTCMSNSLPHAQKLFERFRGDERVAVVAIATAFEKEQYPWMADEAGIKKRLESEKWTFPVMRDAEEKSVKILGFGGSYGTPTTVVLDAEGTVRWHDFNATAETAGQVDATVEALLASFFVAAIPDLSPRLASYEKGDYGKAWALASKLADSDQTEAELAAQCRLVLANIETGTKRMVDRAKQRREEGYPGEAKEKLDEAARVFKGCGDTVSDLQAEWRRDRAFAEELRLEKSVAKLEEKAAAKGVTPVAGPVERSPRRRSRARPWPPARKITAAK